MFEPLFQIEIFRENDIFFGKVHTQAGPREYQNEDYGELVTDMFVDLQDEDMVKVEE